MNQEKTKAEEFELWLKIKFIDHIWIGGHRFKGTKTSDIDVDGALFTETDAKQLYQMLSSNNPLTRLNGSLLIWEKNGILVKLFLVIALLMFLMVFVIVRR
jgi:hypothetical protein